MIILEVTFANPRELVEQRLARVHRLLIRRDQPAQNHLEVGPALLLLEKTDRESHRLFVCRIALQDNPGEVERILRGLRREASHDAPRDIVLGSVVCLREKIFGRLTRDRHATALNEELDRLDRAVHIAAPAELAKPTDRLVAPTESLAQRAESSAELIRDRSLGVEGDVAFPSIDQRRRCLGDESLELLERAEVARVEVEGALDGDESLDGRDIVQKADQNVGRGASIAHGLLGARVRQPRAGDQRLGELLLGDGVAWIGLDRALEQRDRIVEPLLLVASNQRVVDEELSALLLARNDCDLAIVDVARRLPSPRTDREPARGLRHRHQRRIEDERVLVIGQRRFEVVHLRRGRSEVCVRRRDRACIGPCGLERLEASRLLLVELRHLLSLAQDRLEPVARPRVMGSPLDRLPVERHRLAHLALLARQVAGHHVQRRPFVRARRSFRALLERTNGRAVRVFSEDGHRRLIMPANRGSCRTTPRTAPTVHSRRYY